MSIPQCIIPSMKSIIRFRLSISRSSSSELHCENIVNVLYWYIILLSVFTQVTDALPSQWLKSAIGDTAIPELENLCRYMKSCANAYHSANNRLVKITRSVSVWSLRDVGRHALLASVLLVRRQVGTHQWVYDPAVSGLQRVWTHNLHFSTHAC